MGIEGFLALDPKTEDTWADVIATWRDMGATCVAVNTTEGNLKGVDRHLKLLQDFRKAVPK
jgi:hypothetical protein